MKIGAIIQARVSSTRLPKKILKPLPLNGKLSVLEHVIKRVRKSNLIQGIIIATSDNSEDDEIVDVAIQMEALYYRGDLNDVLSRYYYAAKNHNLDIIVRITSDCPCIDPFIIDELIQYLLDNELDYVNNTNPRTFPHGLDVEAFKFSTLENTFKNSKKKTDREHVTSYIYNTAPDNFKIGHLTTSKSEQYGPDIRITLDTQMDYILLCAIFDFLYDEDAMFTTADILNLFIEHPWLKMINQAIVQKKVEYTYNEEIDEMIKIIKLQGLNRVYQKLVELREEGYFKEKNDVI